LIPEAIASTAGNHMKREMKTMKEVKHTPLPWIKGFSHGVGELDPSHNADENGGYMIAKTFGSDAKANLDLIWTWLHSRPKVEELLKAAKGCVPIAETGARLSPVKAAKFDEAQVKRLRKAIREVKAALK
jgi:hypothetical protein